MLSITFYLLLAALIGYGIGFRSSRRYHRRAYARLIQRRLETEYDRGANDAAHAILEDAEQQLAEAESRRAA
jgi:hypothetical protein